MGIEWLIAAATAEQQQSGMPVQFSHPNGTIPLSEAAMTAAMGMVQSHANSEVKPNYPAYNPIFQFSNLFPVPATQEQSSIMTNENPTPINNWFFNALSQYSLNSNPSSSMTNTIKDSSVTNQQQDCKNEICY